MIGIGALVVFGQARAQTSMPVPYTDSAPHRWLQKPVLKTRLLDDFERLASCSQRHTFGYGQPSEPRGQMTLSREKVKSGSYSVRLRAKTKGDRPGPQMGRPFGSTSVVREFPGEDWRDFNRISVWIYPDLPGFRVVSLLILLHNKGEIETPGPGRLGYNYQLLNNQTWNHVVWEIPDLPRDKVTALEFQYIQQGHEPGASEWATYYFDQLELQLVEADYYEGWAVAPGRIAYSHTGYTSGAPKTAIISDPSIDSFELISRDTGSTVLRKPVRTVETPLGTFQLLDFSEILTPGTYIIRAGLRETRPFRIAPDVWIETIWKALNYFFCQRCGFAVPGIHEVCHRDWLGVHGDKKMIINGGWHDAGDVSQGLANTSTAAYAMLSLAEQLQKRGEHKDLAARLLDEARWGMDYIVKTSFGDGHRIVWATHDFWTNGIIGDQDDVTAEAQEDPLHNFMAASAEALAARLYEPTDPFFAGLCRKTAEDDWKHAMEGMRRRKNANSSESGEQLLDTAAAGVVTSVELFRTTGEPHYGESAARLAETVISFQQQEYFKELDIKLAGFFWDSPSREYMLHKHHLSQMHAPILGLTMLCESLPNHSDWMRWYSSIVLYAEYLKAIAGYTQPYGMLPESIYREDEYLRLPEPPQSGAAGYIMGNRRSFREQVLNGVKIGPRHYLRRFPIWFLRRGNYGVILTMAKALGAASRLRKDPEGLHLTEQQLQWIVGRNPFGQSTMTGEGHDFVPHYTALSGDIVGSLPVGIETFLNRDLPYWPTQNHINAKETWVQPVAHWISIQAELNRSEIVAGETDPKPFRISWTEPEPGRISLRVSTTGSGPRHFRLRAHNLHFDQLERTLDLPAGSLGDLQWEGRIQTLDAPWIVVVIPDGDINQLQEVNGFKPIFPSGVLQDRAQIF